jgi:predicted kinase
MSRIGRRKKRVRYSGSMVALTRTSRLTIVCGLPGSGKTTLAKALEAKHGAVRLSADEWMECPGNRFVRRSPPPKGRSVAMGDWPAAALSLGVPIIIEWGTWGRSERDALRTGARALGAAVELHYLSATTDELFARIQRRGMENPPHTREAVLRWMNLFQAPTPEEMALFDAPLFDAE